MMQFWLAVLAVAQGTSGLPSSVTEKRALAPSVNLDYATVIGSAALGVSSFKGIPFAKPPVGDLRLRAPQSIESKLGTIQATGVPRACPQFYFQVNSSALTNDVIGLMNSALGQKVTNAGEDCLTLNVQAPSSANANSKLPVVAWIYGGGFAFGSTQMYDATQLILNSVFQGKPVIYVAINYRVGGFGFLSGKAVGDQGVANLGLLDQRLGLQWIADNIEKFGGDPSKVTIWGESAGSISVFDQMALYGGDNTYKGKSLFRGAIMDSGSIIPADPVDCPKGQQVFEAVLKAAGCQGSADGLACLRTVRYDVLLNAFNSAPAILGYNSVALSYLPRPDGKVLPVSPDVAVITKKYAAVPMIIGDQQDEGTLFSLFQSNITDTAKLVSYLNGVFFADATRAQVQGLVDTYPDDPSKGSPFNTGLLNNIYPQYKRLAAILGDLTFTLARRAFLNVAQEVNPNVPSWSYLATYFSGLPVLGTFHASDILAAYGILPGVPQQSIQSYYLSFINTLDPNSGTSPLLPKWPRWSQSKSLLNFGSIVNTIIPDNFRSSSYDYIVGSIASFHI